MNKKEKVILILKRNDLEMLNQFNNDDLITILIEILNNELDNFDYTNEIDYLTNLIKIFPKYIKNKKKEINESLNIIHQKIKKNLVQKPGNIDKSNHNYKILKDIINDIELIQISLLYDYIYKYDETKYRLIDYIIFDVKNISLIKDAINKFPYVVNYHNSNEKSLIISVIENYIFEVMNYTKEKGIDDIIYYDEVINVILDSPKIIFDVVDRQKILKIIKESLNKIETEKMRKTFYLNILIEKISKKKIEINNSYLEYKYNIKTYFNEAINSEVRSIIDNYSLSKDRKIVDDYILTFDGEDAKEIDDALSIIILENGNYYLGVHIADPMALINENSIIFDEAAKRTTSIYLSNQTYSMFPERLSCDLLSLEEGKYRNAISYYFEIDKIGEVVNYKFYKTIIKVNKNMTYDEFNKILLNKTDDIILNNTIINLSEISNILQKYYKTDELYNKVNRTENNITNTNIIGISNGEKVVETSMIFTNYMVSKYFKNNNLPFIFRNHIIDDNMLKELDQIKQRLFEENNSLEYLKYIEMVKNIYPKAVYENTCKGHYGLGLDSYTHITSPLRRFSDVIASICLDKLYFNEYNEDTKENIKSMILKYANRINNKRTSIEKFSTNYELNN